MIYKLNNGGTVKLQKAGSVPEYGNIEQIAKYNREHGTHFWKMSQVLEHDKQQAQQKTQDKKKSFWEILAGHPESSGEAILNKSIETANNAELPETRFKIYNDTGKAQLTTTAGSLLALPMLGEFSTYGLLGGAARLAGGFGGSAVGSWGLGKAGDWTDKQFGTNWMGTTGRIIGGFAGWPTGSNFTYKGALDLASKVPSIAKIGTTKRFIGDVAGRTLNKELKNIVIPNYMPLNQEHNLFRANVYKGGDITDPYYASFTTDPNYAAQYGKVKPYLIESKSFGIAKEPLMGSSDPVTTDMFIDRNVGNKKLIIGRDAITNEFPYTSNGIEIVSLSPKNIHLVNQPQRTKISGTPFYRDVVPGSRPISEAERLGIPKADRSTLNSDQIEAIDDLLWYLRNGRHKKYFLYNPETKTFRWSSSKGKDGEIGAVRALIEHGATSHGYEDAPVRLSNEYGNFTIWPNENAAFTSNFPIPEGMKWGPGETSLMLDSNHGMKTILTSPRVDLSTSMEDAPIELVNSLPNTIDKSIMRRFWSENDRMIRPGTYLSGDNGQMPLGNMAISAFDRTKSVDSAIQSIINPENARTGRMGLSPDSYSSIIRQGLRGNHKLRWGEGFTKWNDSSVENRAIYEAWKKMNAGEITPEQYKQIFDDWAIPLGGRPSEIRTTPSFRTIVDNDGITRTIAQEPQKYVVMPHPYIMYRKQGGILKAQGGTGLAGIPIIGNLAKKGFELVAKRSNGAQTKSIPTIIGDVITGRDKSFYNKNNSNGSNEIDTYLYGKPYNSEFTGDASLGPDYTNYINKNYPNKNIKTYNTHFGDTLYIDNKAKDLVEKQLANGETVGGSMGRYSMAPSYIVTKEEGRPYDAGGHLIKFSKDENGNVVANMSDIYDFLPEDFNDKYNQTKNPSWTRNLANNIGTPFIVRQNNIPVVFKEIVPEYKTEKQKQLGDFLSQWGNRYDLKLPLRLSDKQIDEIFDGRDYGDDILDFMISKGYIKSVYKSGGILKE